jgi:hypothetical protein
MRCGVITFKNTSGVNRFFSYLGPYGAHLADEATVDIDDLDFYLLSPYAKACLQADLNDTGDITIVQTPAVIVQNEDEVSYRISVTGTSVVAAEICGENSV